MEPTLSFRHSALKIEWAKIRLKELEAGCDAFLKSKPYAVATEKNPDGEGDALNVGLTRGIPPAIQLATGDVVSNLRAALDFAWMGLVRAAHGDSAPKKTLPIASDRQGLITTIRKASIGGAVQEAETLLADRMKTHRDIANGGNEFIAALNDLSNWNKHNLLILNVGETSIRNVSFGNGNTIGALIVQGNKRPVLDFGGVAPSNLSHEGEPTFEIVFGRYDFVEDKPVIPTLINMHQAFAEALKAFCDAFPDERNPVFGPDIRSLGT